MGLNLKGSMFRQRSGALVCTSSAYRQVPARLQSQCPPSRFPVCVAMPSTEKNSAIKAIREAVSSLENTEQQDSPAGKNDNLSKALYEVFKRIPQVRRALQQILAPISTKRSKEETPQEIATYRRVATIATECGNRTRVMEKIFMDVEDIEDAAELKKRYKSAVGGGEPVEALMKGTVECVLKLVKETPDVISKPEEEDLKEVLRAIENLEPSMENATGQAINNYGSGPQSIHFGSGHQNINTGSAPQFNGQFHAPFNFPQGAS